MPHFPLPHQDRWVIGMRSVPPGVGHQLKLHVFSSSGMGWRHLPRDLQGNAGAVGHYIHSCITVLLVWELRIALHALEILDQLVVTHSGQSLQIDIICAAT